MNLLFAELCSSRSVELFWRHKMKAMLMRIELETKMGECVCMQIYHAVNLEDWHFLVDVGTLVCLPPS